MKITIGPDGTLFGLKEFIEALLRSKIAAVRAAGADTQPGGKRRLRRIKSIKARCIAKHRSR